MRSIPRFVPAVIWMIFIFFLSSRQTAGVITSDPTAHFYLFKSFHLIEYAILAILLFFAFLKFRYTLFSGYLYAIVDEIHQALVPGRTSMMRDTFIDLVGLTFGIIIVVCFSSFINRRRL